MTDLCCGCFAQLSAGRSAFRTDDLLELRRLLDCSGRGDVSARSVMAIEHAKKIPRDSSVRNAERPAESCAKASAHQIVMLVRKDFQGYQLVVVEDSIFTPGELRVTSSYSIPSSGEKEGVTRNFCCWWSLHQPEFQVTFVK